MKPVALRVTEFQKELRDLIDKYRTVIVLPETNMSEYRTTPAIKVEVDSIYEDSERNERILRIRTRRLNAQEPE